MICIYYTIIDYTGLLCFLEHCISPDYVIPRIHENNVSLELISIVKNLNCYNAFKSVVKLILEQEIADYSRIYYFHVYKVF